MKAPKPSPLTALLVQRQLGGGPKVSPFGVSAPRLRVEDGIKTKGKLSLRVRSTI